MINNVTEILSKDILYGFVGLLKYGDWYKNKAGDKDFKRSEVAARAWGERKFINWRKLLNYDEEEAISNYTSLSININNYLRKFKGICAEYRLEYHLIWAEYQNNNNKIQNIDSALKKSKTEKVMHVYRRVNEQHFYEYSKIMAESLHLRKKNKVDRKIFFKIMNEFIKNKTEYQDHAYVSTALVQDPYISEFSFALKPIILKIKVPKHTNAAYLGFKEINQHNAAEREILIGRGYHFKYQNAKIINDKYGRESILVYLDLMPL